MLSFAEMLAMNVKPQSATRAPRETKNQWRDTTTMHVARHTVAVAKYRDAVGPRWSTTAKVAERIGMPRMSIFKQLVKYHELGILERRPVSEPYNHHTGWEWRVK